jgi:hypothetical protein
LVKGFTFDILQAHGLVETDSLLGKEIIISYTVKAQTSGTMDGTQLEKVDQLQVSIGSKNDLPTCLKKGLKYLSKLHDTIDFTCPMEAYFSQYFK